MQVRVWLCGDDRDDFKPFGPEVSLKALSLTEVIFFCENSLSFTVSFFLCWFVCFLLLSLVSLINSKQDLDSCHRVHHQRDTKAVDKKVNTGAGSRAGTWQCVSSIPGRLGPGCVTPAFPTQERQRRSSSGQGAARRGRSPPVQGARQDESNRRFNDGRRK